MIAMERKRKSQEINWRSVIGWVVFGFFLLIGPLSGMVSQVLNGLVPSNWRSMLPLLIGAVVVGSIVYSVIRAYNANRNATPGAPSSSPMPPFGGPAMPMYHEPTIPPVTPELPRAWNVTPPTTPDAPKAPTFDPLVNPRVLLIGVIGMLIFGGIGLYLYLNP